MKASVISPILITVTFILSGLALRAEGNLVGKEFVWAYADTVFTGPFVDIDEIR